MACSRASQYSTVCSQAGKQRYYFVVKVGSESYVPVVHNRSQIYLLVVIMGTQIIQSEVLVCSQGRKLKVCSQIDVL